MKVIGDHLFVATGPDYTGLLDHQPYLRTLHDAGFVKPDIYDFGLACDPLSGPSRAMDTLLLIFILLAHWLAEPFAELTAVPELASQVERIARQILRQPMPTLVPSSFVDLPTSGQTGRFTIQFDGPEMS